MTPVAHIRAKALIHPQDRIIMAKKAILPAKFPVEQRTSSMKPIGLWYAIGTEWIDWVTTEMPGWMGDKFYRIEITPRVLKLDTARKVHAFTKRYELPKVHDPERPRSLRYRYSDIDWVRVAKDYAGIEIAPYQHTLRHTYLWYYGWDVASGCIWDKSGVKSIRRIRLTSSNLGPV